MNARAPAADGPPVDGRFGWALGRRRAGGRHDQLHQQDALPGLERKPPRRRALHARQSDDAALPVHGRRPDDVGSRVDRRVSVERDRARTFTSTPATKATIRSAACCAAPGSARPTKPRRARTTRSKTERRPLTICLATQHADAVFTPLALLSESVPRRAPRFRRRHRRDPRIPGRPSAERDRGGDSHECARRGRVVMLRVERADACRRVPRNQGAASTNSHRARRTGSESRRRSGAAEVRDGATRERSACWRVSAAATTRD